MAVVLLDTVVASLLHPKKRNAPQRLLYEPHLRGQILALSFQTIAELFQWAEQNSWNASNRAALDQFISQFLEVPYDRDLGRAWAKIMTHARSIGRRLDAADAWIAASALRHGLALIAHDADFVDLKVRGLTVICHA
ncbi:MAG TPA: PIN domain-containing protein [Tepidisphaeraceae bacterium]|jgi:tRNA(fMet)-specific endonuclease VapC|nr:PIN domain-containing protein [Tepidisphaeraceae bacterium]